MLLGQNLGGGHKGRLISRLQRGQNAHHRDHGFARSHIPLHQPIHRRGRLYVLVDFLNDPTLGSGELKGQ